MGPLYHLIDLNDRLTSLAEAYRVLKPGGMLISTYISRLSPILVEGFNMDYFLKENNFFDDIYTSFQTGLFSTNNILLPDVYFHSIDDIINELNKINFKNIKCIAIEGISCSLKNFDSYWNNPTSKNKLLKLLEIMEKDLYSLTTTSHIAAISYKK